MEHLDPSWISAFDGIVRDHAGLRAASADRRVVVQFTVTDQPSRREAAAPNEPDGAATTYALVLDHGDNRVVPGAHPEPDLRLTTDRATAAAIASHAESAQTAFMSGRLRLGGDVRVLIANQDLLAGIDDCAATLRASTDFPAVAAGDGTRGA